MINYALHMSTVDPGIPINSQLVPRKTMCSQNRDGRAPSESNESSESNNMINYVFHMSAVDPGIPINSQPVPRKTMCSQNRDGRAPSESNNLCIHLTFRIYMDHVLTISANKNAFQ